MSQPKEWERVDLERSHFTDVKRDPRQLAYVGGIGALGGAGLRLARELMTLGGRSPERSPAKLKVRPPSVARIPVEVSEEEAEELRRRGVRVREVLHKTSANHERPKRIAAPRVVTTGPVSPTGAAALGVVGTGSALAGWSLTDRVIGHLRRQAAKGDVKRIRRRIERVLKDDPEEEDEELYGVMKAAEDTYFAQKPEEQTSMEKTAFGLRDLYWLLPATLGAGATFQAVAGFQRAQQDSPARAKIKALKSGLQAQRMSPVEAGMKPFVRRAPVQEAAVLEAEKDEEKEERKAPAGPVVVKEAPGSPAQQARTPSSPSAGWF